MISYNIVSYHIISYSAILCYLILYQASSTAAATTGTQVVFECHEGVADWETGWSELKQAFRGSMACACLATEVV